MNKTVFNSELSKLAELTAIEHNINIDDARAMIVTALKRDRRNFVLTRQQRYERKSITALQFYAGRDGLGLTARDVEQYLGKRVSTGNLSKEDLVRLLMELDKANRGLGDLLS